MHPPGASVYHHSHNYLIDTAHAERRTRFVIAITAAMMIVEIVAGVIFNSMALLADGWHMSTHVAAFLITALAYYFSRRHVADPRYSFGTGKMGVLGGFSSALILAIVALFMTSESIHRFFVPLPIQFNQAIVIAVVGLLVNVVCAFLLKDDDHHHSHHGHTHAHATGDHGHHHHDLNMRAAYLHVIADALTSVTAIIALLAGKYFGWFWLDSIMGIVGSVVIAVWAYSLVRDTGGILLDRTPESSDLPVEIRRAIESDGHSLITDLHVWQVATGKFAAILSIRTPHPRSVEHYRERVREHEELVHLTVEVQPL